MKLNWLCAEKATFASLGVYGLCTADIVTTGGGVAAMAGLFGLWKKSCREKGVNSAALLADARNALLADYANWAEVRDLVEADLRAADHAMEQHLLECVPPVAELAKTTFEDEDFAAFAALLVVNRLADKNVIFSESHSSRSPLAREFALLVMQSALKQAKEQPPFLLRLTQEVVLLLPQHMQRIEGKIDDLGEVIAKANAKSEQQNADMMARLARFETAFEGQFALPETVLRATLWQELSLRPNLSDREAAEAVRAYCAEHELLVQRLARLEVYDNRIAALKADAEVALAAYDHVRTAQLFAEMRQIEDERSLHNARRGAEYAHAEAEAHLVLRDWNSALAVWQDAEKKLRPFAREEAETILETAANALSSYDARYPGGALPEAVELLRRLVAMPASPTNDLLNATRRGNLGAAMSALGSRSAGPQRLTLLQEAQSHLSNATEAFVKAGHNLEATVAINNSGNCLRQLADSTQGMQKIYYTEQSILAYRASLTDELRNYRRFEWAMGQSNYGAMLHYKSNMIEGESFRSLIEEAIQAFDKAAEVYTPEQTPFDWGMVKNNLGNALLTLGQRLEGVEGEIWLDRAADAHLSALTMRTLEAFPIFWAMSKNNLGLTRLSQGKLKSGNEALNYFGLAADDFESALEIRTQADFPIDWAKSNMHLGSTLAAIGDIFEGEERREKLFVAIEKFGLAQNIYTAETFPDLSQHLAGLIEETRTKLSRVT